jgi:hypothetical protein
MEEDDERVKKGMMEEANASGNCAALAGRGKGGYQSGLGFGGAHHSRLQYRIFFQCPNSD